MRIRLIRPWSGMGVGRETDVPGELAARLVDQHIANAIEVHAPPAAAPERAPEPSAAARRGRGRKRK